MRARTSRRSTEASLDSLFSLCRRLRGKHGCPWDRSQTITSLTPYIQEETHELMDSVAAKEYDQVREELGDVLFLLIFMIEIAEEEGFFTLNDVVKGTEAKMKRRHPHVFGGKHLKQPAEVSKQWEEIKLKEEPTETSLLAGASKTLSPLVTSFRLQEKAAAVGFDWPHVQDVMGKIKEEMRELEEALAQGHEDEVKSEIGDLLFSLVNLARKAGVNPEICLRRTINKFQERFASVENVLRTKGKSPSNSTLSEMDELWNQAKEREKAERRSSRTKRRRKP